MTTISDPLLHPDVVAAVHRWQGRRSWSRAAQLLASDVAKKESIEPHEWPEILDRLDRQIHEVTEAVARKYRYASLERSLS